MSLRGLFRPPQSTSVERAVAPLLDAEEEGLREKAAAVLGNVRAMLGPCVGVPARVVLIDSFLARRAGLAFRCG